MVEKELNIENVSRSQLFEMQELDGQVAESGTRGILKIGVLKCWVRLAGVCL